MSTIRSINVVIVCNMILRIRLTFKAVDAFDLEEDDQITSKSWGCEKTRLTINSIFKSNALTKSCTCWVEICGIIYPVLFVPLIWVGITLRARCPRLSLCFHISNEISIGNWDRASSMLKAYDCETVRCTVYSPTYTRTSTSHWELLLSG